MDTTILSSSDNSIALAATAIKQGDIVAFPTETVYGLGASVFDASAIQKIYDVKGRPSDNPLITHISSLSQVDSVAENIPQMFYTLADSFFPGPLTLVVPKKHTVPDIATANLPTIGIRMPHHPVALKLIDAVGTPLVAPSSNLSGKPSPTDAQHVFDDLHGRIRYILDGGPCEVGIESTVIDLTVSPFTILRPGHITQKQIEMITMEPVCVSPLFSTVEIVKSPGMKYRHYAPDATIHIMRTLKELDEHIKSFAPHNTVLMTNIHIPPTYAFASIVPLTEQKLFAGFREADTKHLQNIVILLDEATEKNTGLLNRIEEAANG